ncbi:cytochrome b [Hydrogenophaga crassostreae]|nr:cytochrome b [Hydrogenophaga crassostreae]
MKPTVVRYHFVSRLLHAVLGLALVGLFAVGLYMADLPFSPDRLKLYNWHKWAGVTVLTLAFVRLIWRLTHRPPALPKAISQAMPSWQHVASEATHVGLYVLFFAVPLAGWAYSSAAGFPIVPFGLFQLPDFVPVSEGLADVLKPVHKFSAYAMAALVVLHVAGALKHQFIDRDGLLSRMGFGPIPRASSRSTI